MNFSNITTKTSPPFHILFFLLMVLSLCPSIDAQEVDKPLAAPLSLQERMQKSVSRQMDAVAAMRRSIEARQQTVLRQKGEASTTGFFTLSAPAPMASPFRAAHQEALGDSDSSNNDDENAEEPQTPSPADPPETDPPASKGAGGSRTIVLPADIAGIKGINGIGSAGIGAPGIGTAGDLSLEGILLRQLTASEQDKSDQPPLFPGLQPVSDGKDRDHSGNNSLPRGPGAIDYIRQILDFSTGGPALFQGLTGIR